MINSGDAWSLAPAYDLLNVAIVNPDDTEELALTLEGKKKKLKWEHFERLGQKLGLNDKQLNGMAKTIRQKQTLGIRMDKQLLSFQQSIKRNTVS